MKESKKPYRTPVIESDAWVHGAEMLCESPGEASTEDLTLEQWEI